MHSKAVDLDKRVRDTLRGHNNLTCKLTCAALDVGTSALIRRPLHKKPFLQARCPSRHRALAQQWHDAERFVGLRPSPAFHAGEDAAKRRDAEDAVHSRRSVSMAKPCVYI